MTDHITIFDTTLRDGEQSPGMSMNRPHCHPRESGGLEAENIWIPAYAGMTVRG